MVVIISIFIVKNQQFSGYKKAPEGASAGYANPATRYFVPELTPVSR